MQRIECAALVRVSTGRAVRQSLPESLGVSHTDFRFGREGPLRIYPMWESLSSFFMSSSNPRRGVSGA